LHVRPAESKDLDVCAALDHSFATDSVWQMESREENGVLTTTFRVSRLPREVRVNYPRQDEGLLAGWQRCDEFVVLEDEGRVRGYAAMTAETEHGIARVGDLVVDRSCRRRGFGTALLRAAAQWGHEQHLAWLEVEMQTKNYPAIRFCQSRGLTFCGYNDHYWPNQDIALFFGESLR